MNEQSPTTITNNDMLTALTGILFFGPFIHSEHPFIQGYCKVWKLNLVVLIITLTIFTISYFFPSRIFDRMIIFSTGTICTISIFSIFACLNEVQLFSTNESIQHEIPHKTMIIKSFVPLYNIKLWYQTLNFQTPYRRLKESMLRRTAFSFLTLLLGIQVWTILLALIITRLLLLSMNIDIIPNNLKKLLNHGFLIHPEEIIGKMTKKSWYTDMQESHFNTALQYLTFTAILRMIRKHATLDYTLIIPLLALLYLIAKIFMTYWKYNKLPNIPLLYELRSLIIK